MRNKEDYKKLDKIFGEDVVDLFYNIDNNNLKESKIIVDFLVLKNLRSKKEYKEFKENEKNKSI